MSDQVSIPDPNAIYVCPHCKGDLTEQLNAFHCAACQQTYPLIDGIPDFLTFDLTTSPIPIQRRLKRLDRLARIYESRLWYPLVLNIYAGYHVISFQELIRLVSGVFASTQGLVLDAACGPGTYGRRVASPERAVYGIDISTGMLRRGQRYLTLEGRKNVCLARASVERLPFKDRQFNGVICSGALHLFPDPLQALTELSRVMQSGASIAMMTFIGGERGILKYQRIKERLQRLRDFHVFEINVLANYLAKAGFEYFQPQLFGSLIFITARRSRISESMLDPASP